MNFLRVQTRPLPPADGSSNPKADLANWCGQVGLAPPTYIGEREGPDHYPTFVVRTMLRDIEIGQGRGMRKTQAEVEAATVALRNLTMWTRCLKYEGDKYHRFGTPISSDIDLERARLFAPADAAEALSLVPIVVAQVNAFVNSDGGVVMVGVDPAQLAFTGVTITREEMDQFLEAFQARLDVWEPRPAASLFKVRVWPVFTSEQIENGDMFTRLQEMVSRRDTRGMVWRDGQRIVLSITAFKSDVSHVVPVAQLLEPLPASMHTDRVMYIHTRTGIRLVPSTR